MSIPVYQLYRKSIMNQDEVNTLSSSEIKYISDIVVNKVNSIVGKHVLNGIHPTVINNAFNMVTNVRVNPVNMQKNYEKGIIHTVMKDVIDLLYREISTEYLTEQSRKFNSTWNHIPELSNQGIQRLDAPVKHNNRQYISHMRY